MSRDDNILLSEPPPPVYTDGLLNVITKERTYSSPKKYSHARKSDVSIDNIIILDENKKTIPNNHPYIALLITTIFIGICCYKKCYKK